MTERYSAAILDPDACLDELQKAAGPVQLTLTPAASAEDLIHSVVANDHDVVLLDFEMPGLSGWELTKRLREVNPEIPILLLSANPDWSALERDPLIEMVRSHPSAIGCPSKSSMNCAVMLAALMPEK